MRLRIAFRWLGGLMALGVVSVLVLSGRAQPLTAALASSRAANGLLTYDAWNGGQHTIEVVSAGGGTPRPLAPESTDDPSWAPDGREIAHSVDNAPGACRSCWEIQVTAADGSRTRQLTHGGTNGNPAWSPDGKLIAYSHNNNVIDAPTEIWVMTPNGSGARRLVTSSGHRSFSPSVAWSPDAKTLALTADGLYLIGADGEGLHRLTRLNASFPYFSPNGKLIAFTHSTPEPYRTIRTDIYVIRVDGRGLHRLGGISRQRLDPSFSPDSKKIAFVGATNPSASTFSAAVYRAFVDGSGERRLTRTMETVHAPAWSPDGKLIAFEAPFSSSDNYDVWVMRADGSKQHTVSGSHYAWAGSYLLWQPRR